MVKEDTYLIKLAQQGDMKAFEELIYRYDRQVLNIAASFRNDEDDAKDIYQEVFMRVHRGLKNFQFRSEFSTWLFRITTNVCISYKAKKERHYVDSLDRNITPGDEESMTVAETIEDGTTASQVTENIELSEFISAGVDKLPPKQKMAFTLKHYDGYKIKEIAKMMNLNEGTVKRYLFTATNKMRDYLSNRIEN